ncbi:MAG TPA: helix-turn-helix transcriptional regulator [Xanthobacteraceae bacterium]|nr:helix-turn-helix transcriptional regulator [Xanthobacteraceae bacterium]
MQAKTKMVSSQDIEVGRRIRARRMERGVSQTKLGDRIGVTFQQIQKYEKGSNRVAAGRLQRIAEVLDVPISYFFGVHDTGRSNTGRILRFLDRADALRLIQAYSLVRDRKLQRAIVQLVETVASDS